VILTWNTWEVGQVGVEKLHLGVGVVGWLAVLVLYPIIFMANHLSSTQAF
jgi:hypothetical protein